MTLTLIEALGIAVITGAVSGLISWGGIHADMFWIKQNIRDLWTEVRKDHH